MSTHHLLTSTSPVGGSSTEFYSLDWNRTVVKIWWSRRWEKTGWRNLRTNPFRMDHNQESHEEETWGYPSCRERGTLYGVPTIRLSRLGPPGHLCHCLWPFGKCLVLLRERFQSQPDFVPDVHRPSTSLRLGGRDDNKWSYKHGPQTPRKFLYVQKTDDYPKFIRGSVLQRLSGPSFPLPLRWVPSNVPPFHPWTFSGLGLALLFWDLTPGLSHCLGLFDSLQLQDWVRPPSISSWGVSSVDCTHVVTLFPISHTLLSRPE